MHRILVLALSALPLSSAGAADLSGPEILVKVDDGLNAFKDGVWESKLLVKQPDGQKREYGFTTYQKIPDKRLVRFSSPGDVKGMGVLVQDAETLYVFLPGFNKVRRMGTHIKNQTFMGSDFSFEDMSQLRFGETYDAKLAGAEGGNWVLELTAKAGKDLEFPRLKMWVDKSMFAPTKVDYMDAAGKVLKTQVRDGYVQDKPNHFNPGRVLVTDHRRNEHQSEIDFLSTKLDTGLKDELFSVRALARGQ